MITESGIAKYLSSILPSAIGSAIAIYINRKKLQDRPSYEWICSFFGGTYLGHSFGGGAIEYWSINYNSYSADSIKITVAIFSMAIITEVFIQLPDWLSAARQKWLGK